MLSPQLTNLTDLIDKDDPSRPLSDLALALNLTAGQYGRLRRFCKHRFIPRCCTGFARYRLRTVHQYCHQLTVLASRRLITLRPDTADFAAALDDVVLALDRIRFVRTSQIGLVFDQIHARLQSLVCTRVRTLCAALQQCWDDAGRVRPEPCLDWARDAARFLDGFNGEFACGRVTRADFQRCVRALGQIQAGAEHRPPATMDVFTGLCPSCSGLVLDGRAVLRCGCGQAVHCKCMRAEFERNGGDRFRVPICPKCGSVWTGT